MSHDPSSFLEVHDIEALYGDTVLALRGVSLSVKQGSIVALLGANGAGKTTTLNAISNLLASERGHLRRGRITWQGKDTRKLASYTLVREGIVQVLEGRHVFSHLTVEENILTGGYLRKPGRRELSQQLEQIYTWFPRLKERRKSKAGLTSGGEQQMVAIGRALMTRPTLVLLDEPSMGLAPIVVEEIFEIIRQLNHDSGISFLLAEQSAHQVLHYADHAYLLENGVVALSGPASELAARDDIQAFYLGENRTPSPVSH